MENTIKILNNALATNKVKVVIDEKNKKTNLKDFGVDSITLMAVIVEVESKLSIMLPDDELIKIKTPDDLLSLIEKSLKK